MNYSYTGSGTITTGGCADAYKIDFIEHRWNVNSVLYRIDKARKGVMESVAIKRVLLNQKSNRFNPFGVKIFPVYQDTLNRYWNEGDLTTKEEALLLIEDYTKWLEKEIIAAQCMAKN